MAIRAGRRNPARPWIANWTAVWRWRSLPFGAERSIVKHKGIELLRLHAGLGEEWVGPRVNWRRSSWKKLAAGVDDQEAGGRDRALAQPIHNVEAVAVGQPDIEHSRWG